MRKLGAFIVMLALSLGFSTLAQARTVEYLSQHPVPHKFGGGFCTIDVPHVHNYPPADPRMYRENNGAFYFVGDPAPFDYDGPRYAYYGAHPVAEAEIRLGRPVYCYIKGPHYHWYQPPPQAQFQFSGGAYWYVGSFPRAYYDDRPRYAVINDAYAPLPYARPVVDIQVAPPSVRAEVSIGGPGWRAGASVGGPAAPVYAPPPPPSGPPIQIGVGINLGGPPVLVERREIIEDRRHHDRGRHEGWREPPRFGQHPRHEPPARFAPVRAPVTHPLFHRAQPQRPGPRPHFGSDPRPAPAPAPRRGPAPRPALAPAPRRGPAAPPPAKRDDHLQERHR